jgi:formylglycine-generating enzyme required for sulfatase activity
MACAAEAPVPSSPPVDDGMVLIPAGEFTMGSNKEEDVSKEREANALNPFGFRDRLYVDEHPAHKVTLPDFRMDKYEVSNSQYLEFVTATKHNTPLAWTRNGYNLSDKFLASLPLALLRRIASSKFNLDMDVPNASQEALLAELKKVQRSHDKLPVTNVTWFDARDYCHWAGKRLPTEAEWEKAARGPDGYEFPWGNNWDPKRINTMSENTDQPYSVVGSNPGDVSPYGVYDMAGNVEEWVADWYDAYPGAPAIDNKLYGKVQRVARGGMTGAGQYDTLSLTFRTSRRNHWAPDSSWLDLGFRCAKDVK